ncbi:MAG: tetraacyldisaccharide 4'-kinase [Ignavibacteriae bacterium]|nr:tetraacyldisaccharide 4'-kinase [Ignavibacteriota bacterium]
MLKFIRIILSPLTVLYKLVIQIRNFLFDKNIFTQTNVDVKIISVGNLTVGGSGKTPLTIMLTKYFKSLEKKVGVLSRGYGRSSKGYKLVSDHTKTLTSVNEAGDEIFLVANECNVPTAVSEKRVEGVNKFIKDVDLDLVILDDAFQHRWIDRDIDLLIIDQKFLSNANGFDQTLLPLGQMREPFESIERADVVIVNKKFSTRIEIPNKLKNYLKNKGTYFCHYKVSGIFDVKNNKEYSTKDFEGQQSLVVCGIAKPKSFLRILERSEINIKNKLIFADHKNYTLKEIEKIRKAFYDTNSYSVLTTQKDAVKLMEYSKELDDIDIYFLKVELEIENQDDFLELLHNKIFN